MIETASYPPGVPCWVETLQPDPRAALDFYRALFGWRASGPGPMPHGGEYYVAQLGDADVAGIASLPPGDVAETAWTTYVRVDRLEASIARVRDAGGAAIVTPLDVPPAGRLAIVADPFGATLGLWEPARRRGAQRVNEPGAWAMSTLRTRSLDAALPFYQNVFGWDVEPFSAGDVRGVLFRLPGYVGGRAEQPVPRDVVAGALADGRIGSDHWSVDFWTDDVEAAVARVDERGGTVIRQPFDTAGFRRAVVACPAGGVFTLSELITPRREAPSTRLRARAG